MFVIKGFKKLETGALRAIFDVQIESPKWEIRGCRLFEKNGKQWTSAPTIPYTDKNGEKAYSEVIRMSKEDKDDFSKLCLSALKVYHSNPPAEAGHSGEQEEIPF